MRGEIPEGLARDRHVARKVGSHVAGEKARLITFSLFESKEEERAVLPEWSTQRESLLRAREWRILDRRKRVTRLKTPVTQEAE